MSKKKSKLNNGVYVYKRLLSYVKPYWFAFGLAIIGNILYSLVDAGFTYMLKPLLNKGFIDKDPAFIHWLPMLVVVAFIVRGGANFLSSYFMAYVGRNVVIDFRKDIFEHLLKLPSSFYDNNSSGQLLSKIIYNVNKVTSASTDALTTLVQSGFLIIGLLTVMLLNSWKLTLIYLVTMPVIAVVVKLSSLRMRRISMEVQDSVGDITHIAEEVIEGYQVVRVYGGEEYETQKFHKALLQNLRKGLKLIVTKSLNVSGVQLVASFALALIIFIATSPTQTTFVSAGGFVSFLAAMLALLKPMKNLTSVNATVQKGLAGAQSVFELLAEDTEQDLGSKKIKRATGDIEYKGVEFYYNSEEQKVLHQINFKVKAGQSVAMVGRSGSGKTTLMSLLLRFYDCNSGEILIDGNNVNEYQLKDLREQIAIVSQHVILFNDTIANNIAYGRKDISKEKIIEAAKAAHVMEFVDELPDGLETLIGDNGVRLSGGQRQRLAIARAILKNAPILILDEATSSLDSESERYIHEALDKLMRERTTFIIAHRLSTIENADVILVLDKGRIVEQGTHRDLLQANENYARLHKMQFKDNAEEVLTIN